MYAAQAYTPCVVHCTFYTRNVCAVHRWKNSRRDFHTIGWAVYGKHCAVLLLVTVRTLKSKSHTRWITNQINHCQLLVVKRLHTHTCHIKPFNNINLCSRRFFLRFFIHSFFGFFLRLLLHSPVTRSICFGHGIFVVAFIYDER